MFDGPLSGEHLLVRFGFKPNEKGELSCEQFTNVLNKASVADFILAASSCTNFQM